jgi:hypothetical protein
MEVGMAAADTATAMLPLCSAVVATKTPAATAMVRAPITTNNQLKGRSNWAMATETVKMTATTILVTGELS